MLKYLSLFIACALPLAAAKPNIVFIIADDLGYGDLGCYGQKKTKTPVLDKLAAEGIRFTQHYSGSPVCAPSRSTLMTGLDTGSTWLRGNGEFELRPDPEDLTVATLLKRAGYRTAMIGKSCVSGNTQNPGRVLDKGFDVFYGTTSHNGSHSEGGYNPKMLDSSGPLRGAKRDLYEGGIRVPTIAHWPSGITKPGTSDHISAFWDFLPTACEIAGTDVPAGLHGISYLPTLTGKGEQRAHDFLYWEFHEKDTRRALRQGDWKLVQYDVSKNGKPELYHLGSDLAESKNLAGQESGRVSMMLGLLERHRKPSPIFPNPSLDK